jgi:outer membrane protein insertion porin family
MRFRGAPLQVALFSVVFGFALSFSPYRDVLAQQQQQQPPQAPAGEQTPAAQQLVEDVDVTGNRRQRREDILYYVQTRPGDAYNQQQAERDLIAILSTNLFDKTDSRVTTQVGPRGGVIVIFSVKELPVIRDIQFKGLKSVQESDVLKAFREGRVGVSKESIYDPVKVKNATRVIKELLAARGHPNATIEIKDEEVSQTSIAVTFDIKEGERVRVVEIDFEGNQNFTDGELRGAMKYVKEAGLISRFKGQDILDRQKLEEDMRLARNYMAAKGYLRAQLGEPRIEGIGERRTGLFIPLPLLSSVDEALRVTIPVIEGKVYRIGEFKIEGNSIFNEQQIQAVLGVKAGEVANGERIGKALYENLKKYYGAQGFIQYSPELTPTFRDDTGAGKDGVVDFLVTIDEGKQFSLRRLEFTGNTFTRDNVLRREVLLNEGDVYNQQLFELSVNRLNQTGYFDPIDKEKDADFRTNEEEGLVDVSLKVAERGRQQISFNGGVSGIGGSFFGLDYSTNNLLGRGESLSFQLAAGNRQRSFLFSFTEPYIKNRPITAGFSIYTQSLKYFGPGTSLSQNLEALQGVFGNSFDYLNTAEENLFTQTTTGASVYASAPLDEFYRRRRFTRYSRVGLSYSLSQTSVKDPEVNQQNNEQTFIPVLYRQPKILTSRITPSFVYDSRNAAIDPTEGVQLSLSLGFAGLGGDVRTYSPSASYIQFIPVRRKNTDNPEVFGFRLIAGHIGSFSISDAVRNTQSLAFINGIPIYERFFLGDEFTIRGYNVRSIGPIVPLENYVSAQNTSVASNETGSPVAVPGLSPSQLPNGGFVNGPAGGPATRLVTFQPFTVTGGDTQLLGNFEYRIPIFGPVTLAAYTDIGTAFNLREGTDQFFSTEFIDDQPYLQTGGLTALRGTFVRPSLSAVAAAANSQLAFVPTLLSGALVARDGRFVSQAELDNARRVGPLDPNTGLPTGFQPVFLRGEAQTNTIVRLSQSNFSHLSDYRASIGMEFRIQVPVVNVPFRLIYAYNPNARPGASSGLFFDEKKSVFRFSIGRTF